MNRPSPLLLSLSLFLGLAACQAAPTQAPRRPVARAPSPPPAATPSEVEGAWSFRITGDRCIARVAHESMTLAVTAGPGGKASFSLTAPARSLPAGRTVRIGFKGDGGNWLLPGRTDAQRAASASMTLDGTGEGRIRDLLGGGTVSVSGSGVSAPALSVPDAGVSGRDWYACVARQTQS
ncbi:hypothetical protein [Roseomonas xinghualingensis]|uniref:hypothetical protein n=1 Tax=Roseomonas xinghualingensis TaxID=2986475 RepID=UPI0021F1B2BA|nr:hypothetical protein [Roseomonas sp. SXEYE001]MCV4208158.1 hypothetical protein [Roseomonas sp. SXEYE001]